MGCCYSVSMSLRATDEERFVRASHEFYSRMFPSEESVLKLCKDVVSIVRYAVCDVDKSGRYRNDNIVVKKFKTGRVYLSTAFNHSYGWFQDAMDWFEAMSSVLANNSWMIIYGEGNEVARMRVKNGRFCVK